MKQRVTKNLLPAALIFGGFVFFHYIGWLQRPETFLKNLIAPFLISTHGFSIDLGERSEFFKSKENFFSAYKVCVAKNENIENLEAQNKILKNENELFKQQLNFVESTKYKSISTSVIGNDILDNEKIISLNSGSDQGINLDAPVTTEGGLLVGKIIKVNKNSSVARLITHHDSRFEASILNKDESLGVVVGGYGGNLKMEFVPKNEIISVNDIIITSGFEKKTPRGLVIGKVIGVENEAYQGFQKITVASNVSLSKLTIVTVLGIE